MICRLPYRAVFKTMFWIRLGLLLLCLCCVARARGPTVYLPEMGEVEGNSFRRSVVLKRNFDSYLGIPFGKSTGGNLRYKAPEWAEPWAPELFNANIYGRECPQTCPPRDGQKKKNPSFWQNFHEFFGDNETFAEMDMTREDIDYEDCLFTHVFTPTREPNQKLPVMIFYHGGSFHAGSSKVYWPDFFMDYDMILVVPHYRLGSLGFVSLQNEEVPGNAGMLDQVLAIDWTIRFIENFGGDPTQITVFGESAGAASVSLLALSPLTKGKIKGIIAESGAALAEWSFDREPVYNALGVAEEAGCNMTSMETITACFMEKDACTILEAQDRWSARERERGRTGFGGGCPTYQTTGTIFLDRDPADIWKNPDPDFVPVPAIYGANKHEGTYVLDMIYNDFLEPNGLLDDNEFLTFDVVRPFITLFGVSDNADLIRDSVEYEYIGIERMGNMTAMSPGLIDFGGSTFLKAPGYESTVRHARYGSGKSYQYAYNFEGPLTKILCSQVVGTDQPFPSGVCHAAEVPMLFGFIGTYQLMNDEEKRMSNTLTKMWYNFAKYGDPTSPENPIDGVVDWLPYDDINQYYMRFDKEISLLSDYKRNEYQIAKDEDFGL